MRSAVGEVRVEVAATDDVMPGVVSLPHGYGHRRPGVRLRNAEALPGVSMNDLTDPSVVEGLSGNAVLNGVPVTSTRSWSRPVTSFPAVVRKWSPRQPFPPRGEVGVTPDDVRRLALDLPDVVERDHHGFPSFRTGARGTDLRHAADARRSCG